MLEPGLDKHLWESWWQQFDEDVQTLEIRPEHRKAGAAFDHFGVFNGHIGGSYVEVYFDDLEYSAK